MPMGSKTLRRCKYFYINGLVNKYECCYFISIWATVGRNSSTRQSDKQSIKKKLIKHKRIWRDESIAEDEDLNLSSYHGPLPLRPRKKIKYDSSHELFMFLLFMVLNHGAEIAVRFQVGAPHGLVNCLRCSARLTGWRFRSYGYLVYLFPKVILKWTLIRAQFVTI